MTCRQHLGHFWNEMKTPEGKVCANAMEPIRNCKCWVVVHVDCQFANCNTPHIQRNGANNRSEQWKENRDQCQVWMRSFCIHRLLQERDKHKVHNKKCTAAAFTNTHAAGNSINDLVAFHGQTAPIFSLSTIHICVEKSESYINLVSNTTVQMKLLPPRIYRAIISSGCK